MNVRCCLLFATIFAMRSSGAVQLHPRWHVQRCACSDLVNEVCGSDDITYQNLCELDCASVFSPDLTMKSMGPCQDEEKICSCPAIYEPVCASNGVTYSGVCDVDCLANVYGQDIHVEFNGVCPGDEDVLASIAANVYEDPETYPVSPAVYLPCSAYSAPDRRCNSTLCESEESIELCGNNGITYQNYCEFCCAYFQNPDFKIVQKGDCSATVAEEAASTENKEKTKRKFRKSGN